MDQITNNVVARCMIRQHLIMDQNVVKNVVARCMKSEDFRQVIGKPAQAAHELTEAYLMLNSFKAGLDAMQEIPAHLKPHYRQAMLAIDKVVDAQKEVTQLRGMMQRYRF